MIHGSGGVGAVVDRWSQELLSIGVATFIVDSFTGRGITTVRDDQDRLSGLTMIVDAYRALQLLAKHQRVDVSRIGLMGFSRGGHVTLYASLRRFQRMHGTPGLEFAIYLPFYASCGVRYLEDGAVSSKPIRLFHGAADDWVPVGPCREYVAALREKGADILLTEYEGAYHAFDNPLLTKRIVYPNAQTDRNCLRREGPDGEIVNVQTGQRFTFEDACVERGTTVVYDPTAHAAAIADVKRLLRVTFELQ
jgi:dienelactone hydrolase